MWIALFIYRLLSDFGFDVYLLLGWGLLVYVGLQSYFVWVGLGLLFWVFLWCLLDWFGLVLICFDLMWFLLLLVVTGVCIDVVLFALWCLCVCVATGSFGFVMIEGCW